jgi:hypothetical protein
MNTRTSIVHQPDEPFGNVECKPVQGDNDRRYALHIGWDLTLIGGLEQLLNLADKISDAVEAAATDRFNQMDQLDADDIAVIDDDWVQDNIKNPGEQ